MTKKIMTISDLDKASPSDIEQIRSSINLAKLVRDYMSETGTRKGLTIDEYEEHLRTRKERKQTCKTCKGLAEQSMLPLLTTAGLGCIMM